MGPITLDMIRRRAEHNDGVLETLEVVATRLNAFTLTRIGRIRGARLSEE